MKQREKKKKKQSSDSKLHKGTPEVSGKSKKSREKKKNDIHLVKESENFIKNGEKSRQVEIVRVTSDNEDPSKGMKSKITKKDLKHKRRKRKDCNQSEIIESVEKNEESDGNDVGKITKKDLKHKRKKRKDCNQSEIIESVEKNEQSDGNDVYQISSGDEDGSKGMKKWVLEYHQSRPGLKVLQQRVDEFITAHEEQLEQERKEREARAAEGGWTVVVHHKGRKKTTDAETGITVGSVAQAAVEDKMSKKKPKEVSLDFYRFQRREAQRNEIMTLQSKFELDKKRIQQLRAARKFRPY